MANAIDDTKALERVPWLAPLGRQLLAQLACASRRVELDRGGVLWRRGDRADGVTVIVEGRIDVIRDTADGQRILLRSLEQGDSAGLSSGISGLARSADLVAATKVRVLVVPGRALQEAIRSNPDIALGALAQLGDTICKLSDEMEELRFLGLDERLLRIIRRRARGQREIRITHEELAQQAGATRENVSRALKRMERRGIIRCRRGRIDVANP
jgi:CRP/FNR family transcriptional regulator